MAREVGFEGTRARQTVADRVLDRHRARRAAKLQKAAARASEVGTQPSRDLPRGARRWFAIIFLSVWLTFWTAGVASVGLMLLAGRIDAGGLAFVLLWEAVALVAWVWAVRTLFKLVRNR